MGVVYFLNEFMDNYHAIDADTYTQVIEDKCGYPLFTDTDTGSADAMDDP